MGTSRGYSNYRGRTSFGKVLLIVVLVLVILGAGIFLFLQKYLVYNDDGSVRLELPWQTEEEIVKPPSSAGEENVDLVIQEPEKPTAAAVAALLLRGAPEEWIVQAGALAQGGQNAFAVTVKDGEGRLHYSSTAGSGFLAADAEAGSQALEALLAGENHAIARLGCLRDAAYAQENLDGAGLKNTGGYAFYDASNQRWLDGAKEGTGAYLSALAKECAELGFDELLLTDFTYPTAGKLDKIAYGQGSRTEVLAALLGSVRAAVEPYGLRLSLELPKAVVESGKDEKAGLDTALLVPQLDAVYVTAPETEREALAAKLPEGVALVLQTEAAPQGEGGYLLLS